MSFGYYIVNCHNVINRMKYIEPTLAILDVDGDSIYIVRNTLKIQDTLKTEKDKIDSLIISYNNRVRKLEKAITEQREENNTIVDRSSAWLAFWMSVLTVILAVPGFFSIIQTHKNNAKIKEETDKIEPAIKKSEEILDTLTLQIRTHFENSKITLAESNINSLMSCVNHVLEPGIYGKNSDINELLRYYLIQLVNELSECIECIVRKKEPNITDIKSFPIILFELQTIFDKMQMLNTNMDNNLQIKDYIIFLVEKRTELMESISLSETEKLNICLTEIARRTKKAANIVIYSGGYNTTKYNIRKTI